MVFTGAAAGVGSYKGDMGPWLELFVGHDFRLGPGFALRLEGSFLYTSYSHDSSFQQIDGTEVLDVESTDDVWGIGGHVRGLLAYELSRHWALRAGVLLGLAHESMTSSHCPADSLTAPFHGLSAGGSVRLGATRRLELGLLADFVAYPLIYCAGREPPETHERDELSFDDPTLAATGRFAVHW